VQLTCKPLPFWFSLTISHEKLLFFPTQTSYLSLLLARMVAIILRGFWTMTKGNHKKKKKGKLSDDIPFFLLLQMNKIKL